MTHSTWNVRQRSPWEPRPARPAVERTTNLYRNLGGIIAAVQTGFLATFAAVYAYAAVLMTGDPFNDLGVALGREMVLNDIAGLWFVTSILTVAVAVVLAVALPRRWGR